MPPLQKISLDQSSAIECIRATLTNEAEPSALDGTLMRRKGSCVLERFARAFPWRKMICERSGNRLGVELFDFKRLVLS
jgi:hypothetical protein